jgi:hypothetical protein
VYMYKSGAQRNKYAYSVTNYDADNISPFKFSLTLFQLECKGK